MIPDTNPADEWSTFVSHLECSRTGERYRADSVQGLSAEGAPLLVRYDPVGQRSALDRESLSTRRPGMWRYREFLPVARPEHVISLGEAETPLIPIEGLGSRVWVKDEGRLPTGSFKARGMAVAVSMARQLGAKKLVMASNGNAGAALAAYGTRAGLETAVFCPAATPRAQLEEIAAYGATLTTVDGDITACGHRASALAAADDWFDVSTLREPYRIEGKKTMGLELAEQLGWRLPDVIVYPTGGGTGLIGMWKVFAELSSLGWLGGSEPRMVAVQAAGCAPIVRAFERGEERAEPWPDPATVASGILVPAAIGDFLILRAIRESGGFALAVTDEAILDAQRELATEQGLLTCPEGAATFAAYQEALGTGLISSEDEVVLFNCGSGLKYPLP